MDYLYENLGDERFQEFCNALIAKEFQNLQAFPVGQPDGGRDALVYFMNSPQKPFIVFQVKFVRNPQSILDPHKWLTEILKDEIEKIEELIPKGAKEYYLLTNVKGTAHLNNGSIDKVNKILEKSIAIPAQCWWRDDISRRFEKDPTFKWSFLEILNGQDVLNSLIIQNINDNKDYREAVIKAYLTDQYKMDNEVKFKQIDLQNKLIDLYTDVPLRIKEFNKKNKKLKDTLKKINISNKHIFEDDVFTHKDEGIGAANFLLNPIVQNEIERILLEGGPGQGKSTISQYICQIHRAKLLNKIDDLKLLSEIICKCPVRIPFKIDLRHIASWVENKNPYISCLSDEYFNSIWKKSLESFLIGHIIYHSQMDKFNSSDLIAIIKNSLLLFVFDGFDEIANVNTRQEVIQFIDDGLNRIKSNSKSIQVLITSRPAAFSNTGNFPIDTYPHFELIDITPSYINEYVVKWIKSGNLDATEGNEIKRLTKEKLQIPHLRELTKSPMQLAIFISLLRTKGESLPNKRTVLYDDYIRFFFDREAEKSKIVRNNRDLIIDIHKYLAWLLHSEAELYNNNGCIALEQLKEKLNIYLEKEKQPTNIADELFQVVKERVCALVSRVQGTYEFEVQPLREYFCAKYLYETAPYCPAGINKSGTKQERFRAIARDFYWNNVVRFYAGCFDKGEIPMLVDELEDLQNDDMLKYTSYPKLLSSQLLSDWVFTQSPKYLNNVVNIILDGIKKGSIINQNRQFYGYDEPILLPEECNRINIIKECFEQLSRFPHIDYATELIGVIVNNHNDDVLKLWENELESLPSEKILLWLEYACKLGIIRKIDKNILLGILSRDENLSLLEQKLQVIINGGGFDIINYDVKLKQIALDGILSGNILVFLHEIKYSSALRLLSIILHPRIANSIMYNAKDKNESFIAYIHNWCIISDYNEEQYKNILNFEAFSGDNIDKSLSSFYKDIVELLQSSIYEWKNNIINWNHLIEKLRTYFGDRWSFKVMSSIIAGIKAKNSLDKLNYSLTDTSLSLCDRASCARIKRGDLNYWESELNNHADLPFVCLMFLTWATPNVINNLYDKIQNVFSLLSDVEKRLLFCSLPKTKRELKEPLQVKELLELLQYKSSSFELRYLISFRLSEKAREIFISSQDIGDTNIFKYDVEREKLDILISKYLKNVNNKSILEQIKEKYKLFGIYEYSYRNDLRFYEKRDSIIIPKDIANEIMQNSLFYPRQIVSLAEKACRLYANKKVNIVGEIASKEKWFNE